METNLHSENNVTAGDAASPAPDEFRKRLEHLQHSGETDPASARGLLLRDAAALVAETLETSLFGFATDKHSLVIGSTTDADSVDPDSAPGMPGIGQAMIALAVENGATVASRSLATDSRFRDAALVERGIQSGVLSAIDLRSGRPAAIAAFSEEERTFTPSDILLIDSIGQLVAATLERIQAEQRLAAREAHYRTLIDTTPSVVVELNQQGEIHRFNRACEHLTGFEPDEVAGRRIAGAFFVPEETGKVAQSFERLRRGERAVDFQCSVLTKTGVRRRVNWSFAAANIEGEPGLLGSGVDVTDQWRLARQLKREQEALKTGAGPQAISTNSRRSNDISSTGARPFSALPEGILMDRRKRPRRAYPYQQLIAPYVDGKKPSINDFKEVGCRDIASGGFSFLSNEPPKHQHYVVALGMAPPYIYLTTEVVHTSALQERGETVYLVGCRYTGRLEL